MSARRRHRRHPRRRERRPRLGLEDRHDGRRAVPQPPRRRAAVPDATVDRGPGAPRPRRRCPAPGCARTSGTTSPPSRAARSTSSLTLDESTYEEQDGRAEADDHPIAWCSNYDGGRHFYTALGHHGTYWAGAAYREHILGAIEWAAGAAEGDCGEQREGLPTDAAFDKVTLDDNTENPMEIAIAPDRRSTSSSSPARSRSTTRRRTTSA